MTFAEAAMIMMSKNKNIVPRQPPVAERQHDLLTAYRRGCVADTPVRGKYSIAHILSRSDSISQASASPPPIPDGPAYH